jgi:hypothetical protein
MDTQPQDLSSRLGNLEDKIDLVLRILAAADDGAVRHGQKFVNDAIHKLPFSVDIHKGSLKPSRRTCALIQFQLARNEELLDLVPYDASLPFLPDGARHALESTPDGEEIPFCVDHGLSDSHHLWLNQEAAERWFKSQFAGANNEIGGPTIELMAFFVDGVELSENFRCGESAFVLESPGVTPLATFVERAWSVIKDRVHGPFGHVIVAAVERVDVDFYRLSRRMAAHRRVNDEADVRVVDMGAGERAVLEEARQLWQSLPSFVKGETLERWKGDAVGNFFDLDRLKFGISQSSV